MSLPPFATLAGEQRPGLARLLLAAAAEFRAVDADRARVSLDQMAARLHGWVAEQGLASADAVAQLLAERRIRPSQRVRPDDAMLDRVLERGEGHPALIAALCVEAACRAGLPVAPAGFDMEVLVGVRSDASAGRTETVVLDPAGRLERVARGLSWRCSHEVAFVALSELSRLFCLTGDISNALRAAELRADLPVSGELRARLAFEAGALQANLN